MYIDWSRQDLMVHRAEGDVEIPVRHVLAMPLPLIATFWTPEDAVKLALERVIIEPVELAAGRCRVAWTTVLEITRGDGSVTYEEVPGWAAWPMPFLHREGIMGARVGVSIRSRGSTAQCICAAELQIDRRRLAHRTDQLPLQAPPTEPPEDPALRRVWADCWIHWSHAVGELVPVALSHVIEEAADPDLIAGLGIYRDHVLWPQIPELSRADAAC